PAGAARAARRGGPRRPRHGRPRRVHALRKRNHGRHGTTRKKERREFSLLFSVSFRVFRGFYFREMVRGEGAGRPRLRGADQGRSPRPVGYPFGPERRCLSGPKGYPTGQKNNVPGEASGGQCQPRRITAARWSRIAARTPRPILRLTRTTSETLPVGQPI